MPWPSSATCIARGFVTAPVYFQKAFAQKYGQLSNVSRDSTGTLANGALAAWIQYSVGSRIGELRKPKDVERINSVLGCLGCHSAAFLLEVYELLRINGSKPCAFCV
ncbi:hypothetical protein BJ508DRAFT_155059 [Ascobolus immersus RN42]|uniref:Uncharacterized protein n=1 Tax=Ascobolus immersus RN42 TaxID=1160509 RepID=A0A3N4HXR0_ASCIM|nr:hypothetical protein BJ508DRAFT_155059 [Ascobolus immersus RN42]